MSQGVYFISTYDDVATINKPDCPGSVALTYIMTTKAAERNGNLIAGFEVKPVDNGGSWTYQPRINEVSGGWRNAVRGEVIYNVVVKCG
jgi:hypothetical protein